MASASDEKQFIAGGYILAFKTEVLPEWADFPSVGSLVSAGGCMMDLVHPLWRWPDQPRAGSIAVKLGVSTKEAEVIKAWVSTQLDSGAIGFPGVFQSIEQARKFCADFLPGKTEELLIIGIALESSVATEFIEEESCSGDKQFGVVQILQRGQRLEHGGAVLGFDVLAFTANGDFHSWLCYGEAEECKAKFDILPNDFGLLDSYDLAIRVVENANNETANFQWDAWMTASYAV